VQIIAGSNRIGTAIATSGATFAANTAKSVVLATDQGFSDALAGGPLAAFLHGPLLLNGPSHLNAGVLQEIQRVLPSGGSVYLLGGTGALGQAITQAIQEAGYVVKRVAGPNRFGTAVDIAKVINPSTIFEVTGLNFPDALSAGPAAVLEHGAILLTNGAEQALTTADYLAQHSGDVRYAVGGPAGLADSGAIGIGGPNRYATSAAVASRFFGNSTHIVLATGANPFDALAASPAAGLADIPIMLVKSAGSLPTSILGFLNVIGKQVSSVIGFGGTSAIGKSVYTLVDNILSSVQADISSGSYQKLPTDICAAVNTFLGKLAGELPPQASSGIAMGESQAKAACKLATSISSSAFNQSMNFSKFAHLGTSIASKFLSKFEQGGGFGGPFGGFFGF
jgi:putative cell wall-binding protein